MIKQAKIVANSVAISFKLIWNSYFSMEQIMAWIQEGVVAKKEQMKDDQFIVEVASAIRNHRQGASIDTVKRLLKIIIKDKAEANRERFYVKHDLLGIQESECDLCNMIDDHTDARHDWIDNDWYVQVISDYSMGDLDLG